MNKLLIIVMLAVLIAAVVIRSRTTMQDRKEIPRSIQGTLLDVDSHKIALAPRPSQGTPHPTKVCIPLSYPATMVLRSEIDIGGVKSSPSNLGELHAGQLVAVSVEGNVATQIKILPPTPVIGRITKIDESLLSVQDVRIGDHSLPPPQNFVVVPGHTRFMASNFETGPQHSIPLSAVRAGQSARAYASEGMLLALQILPPPAVAGELRQVSATAISIIPEAVPGTAPTERAFVVDPLNLEVFDKYFGMPVERTELAKLRTGQHVAISEENGALIAIAVLHPPIYGKITSLNGKLVTLATTGGSTLVYGSQQTLEVDPQRSRILLAKLYGSHPTPRGNTARVYRYAQGGKLSDLKIGDLVSVTARGSMVVSMRVTPPSGIK